MITVKLLGGAKKTVGKEQISIEMRTISMKEILKTLASMSQNASLFSSNNMLIVVNGIELSLLGGLDTSINDGDVVSVATVVHGGSVDS